MYERTYPNAYTVPEHYHGIALEECAECPEEAPCIPEPPLHSETYEESAEESVPCACKGKRRSEFSERALAFLGRLPFHLPRFEGEDFLLIGAALLLFFSKNGDKECALIFLALLFIG